MEGNETNIQTPAPEPNVDSINWGKEIFEWVACFVIAIVNPVIALLTAIGKEIYDVIHPNNHFCWKDILFDVAGLICGSVIHVIILLLIC